jgi:hypothetical protein
MTLSWRAVLVAVACAMAVPATAHAAPSITIRADNDAIESNPNEQNIELGVSGTTTTPNNRAWLHMHSSSQGCGADPRNDPGSWSAANVAETGDYSDIGKTTITNAGSYLLCAWLTDENRNSAVVATDSRPFTVRLPHLSLSIEVPPVVTSGAPFQIADIASAEAMRFAWLDVLPDTGSGCPATQSAAQAPAGSEDLMSNHPVLGGPATLPVTHSLEATGPYLACAYFYTDVAHGHNTDIEGPPEASAQASFKVVPPCIVPAQVVGLRLAAAKALVLKGNCRLGRTKHVRSRRYGRGRVTGASVPLGQHQANGRLVHLAVSIGRPRSPSKKPR